MRLWHIDLIPYLPNSQLIAQWRELNSIFKKQDKHILINYIYDYDKSYLLDYTTCVLNEMHKRSIAIRSFENYNNYFNGVKQSDKVLRYPEHNNDYLHICFNNLKEKYIRGQKGFTKEIFEKLYNFYLTNARFNVIIAPRRMNNYARN